MNNVFAIKVYKQYFNFASSHFMLFKDGSREPLHGHNYRVMVKGNALDLDDDMVFDFLHIKPIVREICDGLDHRLLVPTKNLNLGIEFQGKNIILKTKDESFFSLPSNDCLLLPIENTSAERIACYIAEQIKTKVFTQYKFKFKELEIEVEETPGQSALYVSKEN